MLLTVIEAVSICIWNNMTSFYVALVFVIPLTYLFLQRQRQQNLPRQKPSSPITKRVAPSNNKGDGPITAKISSSSLADNVTTVADEMESKNNARTVVIAEFASRGKNTISDPNAAVLMESDNNMDVWNCKCFTGQFLPKSIFGNMEAVLKMGTGECYHKMK